MQDILLVQPYVPDYRVEFFTCLRNELWARNFSLHLVSGYPASETMKRSDYVLGDVTDRIVKTFHTHRSGRGVRFKNVLPELRKGYSAVIVEQAIGNVESWVLSGLPNIRLALWGHGISTHGQGSVEKWLWKKLLLRSNWFFAYNRRAAINACALGFSEARTSLVMNSTDTSRLRRDLQAVSVRDATEFCSTSDTGKSFRLLYMGALVSKKKILRLLQALKIVHAQGISVSLMVMGDGPDMRELRQYAATVGGVVFLGNQKGEDKALTLRSADALVVPEWLGLAVIDGLTAGLPIITSKGPHHPPEIEYLMDSGAGLFAEPTAAGLASTIVELASSSDLMLTLRTRALSFSQHFSAQSMAVRFADGVGTWLENEHRASDR